MLPLTRLMHFPTKFKWRIRLDWLGIGDGERVDKGDVKFLLYYYYLNSPFGVKCE